MPGKLNYYEIENHIGKFPVFRSLLSRVHTHVGSYPDHVKISGTCRFCRQLLRKYPKTQLMYLVHHNFSSSIWCSWCHGITHTLPAVRWERSGCTKASAAVLFLLFHSLHVRPVHPPSPALSSARLASLPVPLSSSLVPACVPACPLRYARVVSCLFSRCKD